MAAHLYQVGDLISLNSENGQVFSKLNPFVIEAQMPHVGSRLQYRIKSPSETCRRVVPEHQIAGFGEQPPPQPIVVSDMAVTPQPWAAASLERAEP